MRRRSLTQRIFSALLAIWFSFVVAEPVPVHACPMHDGTHTALAAEAPPQAVHHGHAVVAEVTAHAAHAAHAPADHDTSTGHGNHQCDCLGCCAGSSALSLPTFAVSNLRVDLAAVQGAIRVSGEVLATVLQADHARPFAIGPPMHRIDTSGV